MATGRRAASLQVVPVLTTALAVAPIGVVAEDAGIDASPELVLALLLGVVVAQVAIVSVVRRTGTQMLPGDVITLLRTGLVGACCGWTLLIVTADLPARTWWLAGVAGLAWLLDGVDGYVARRSGTASTAGASLDMEIDSILLLALAIVLAPMVGWWVLAIGLMRYAWWVLLRLVPRLATPLPHSRFRRVVAATQGGVLVGCAVPLVPAPLAMVAAATALALLVLSFGRDAGWAARQAARTAPVGP